MKTIISFNDIDGSSKIKYINYLKKLNPDLVEVIKSVYEYYPYVFQKNEQDIDKICNMIYESVNERNKDIQKSNKPIVIVEDGIDCIDLNVINMLISNGLTYEQATEKINKIKCNYGVKDYVDNDVLFSPINKNNLNIFNEKAINKQQLSFLKKFKNDKYKSKFIIIDAKSTDDEIVKKLNLLIQSNLKNQISSINGNRFILGIGGLSESGKSSTGRILMNKFNIPNFKYNYINDVVKKTYGLDKKDNLFNNSVDIIGILVIDEIINLLNRMYYWSMVSFESLHDYGLTKKMKELLPNNFMILFLKTDKKIRIVRNAIDFSNNLLLSETEIDKKDFIKKNRGAEEIEKLSDYVINNNSNVEELEKKLYNILNKIERRNRKMRNRAGGILIEDGKVLLMHRIKNVDGVVKEYYVVPGGGIEEGENVEEATKRELKEEIGIDVELIRDEPLFTLEQENGIQYFSLINKISGIIGTGDGPEFTDPGHANRGVYSAEVVSIKDIIEGKVNMVPELIKDEFIELVNSLDKEIGQINSEDFLKKDNKMIKELKLK